MWFSNNKGYGDAFAYLYKSSGLGHRRVDENERNVLGYNFLTAIPKKGIYRTLASPKKGSSDHWEHMPFFKKDNHIYRLSESRIKAKKKSKKVLTDDVVNWSKELGDSGIFLHQINDGEGIKITNPDVMRRFNNNQPVKRSEFKFIYPVIEEFISQPGFTKKVKFIEGNTGDFDINNPYKYSYNPSTKDNFLNVNYANKGSKIKLKKI